jgi:hypothetical protein
MSPFIIYSRHGSTPNHRVAAKGYHSACYSDPGYAGPRPSGRPASADKEGVLNPSSRSSRKR